MIAAALLVLALGAGVTDAAAGVADAAVDASPADAGGALPAGHAPTGHAHAQTLEQMLEAPPDGVEPDAALPPGSIAVELRDEADKPLAGFGFTLASVRSSVAKGDSREHRAGATDAAGRARMDGLARGSDVSYRVSASRDGAAYGSAPFFLDAERGSRVVLHVYPATSDLAVARVVVQGVLYVDLKDDRVQVHQVLTIMNFGRTAWVPADVVMPLPSDFTALRASQTMSDVGVEPAAGRGARLRGTFGPGRRDVELSWQVPYHGSDKVDVTVGMPPHVVVLRVMAVAGKEMHLAVDGFPASRPGTDPQGQRVLFTQREVETSSAPISEVRVHLTDIPTPGAAPFAVAAASAAVVALGLMVGRRRTRRDGGDPKEGRSALLSDLEILEGAKAAGEVGPKTYEKARRDIVDAIARTFRDRP